MLSHLLYSSLGLQLGYRVVYIFRNMPTIYSVIWQTTGTVLTLGMYCEYSSAHALKAVNVRGMLGITASLTLGACQTLYKFKQKHYEKHIKYTLGGKSCLSIMLILSHSSTMIIRVLNQYCKILYRVWYFHERFWHHLCSEPAWTHLVL